MLSAAARFVGVDVGAVNAQVRPLAVDRLLVVADEAEPARLGTGGLQVAGPGAQRGVHGAGDFGQDAEHLRVGVLRFVEDDDVPTLPQPPQHRRLGHQPAAPVDLVAVGHQALLQPVVAVGPRDDGRQRARRVVKPVRVGLHGTGHGFKEGLAAAFVVGEFDERRAALEVLDPTLEVLLVFAGLRLGAPAVVVQRDAEVQGRRGSLRVEARRRVGLVGAELPGEFQELIEGEMTADAFEQRGRQGDGLEALALAELVPQRGMVAVLQQTDVFRQTQKASLVADELEAEAVNGAEERAPQVGQQRLPSDGPRIEVPQHGVARADSQFLGGELAVGNDDQLGKQVRLLAAADEREVGNPAHDGRRLADTRPGGNAEVAGQVVDERMAGVFVEEGGRWRLERHRV